MSIDINFFHGVLLLLVEPLVVLIHFSYVYGNFLFPVSIFLLCSIFIFFVLIELSLFQSFIISDGVVIVVLRISRYEWPAWHSNICLLCGRSCGDVWISRCIGHVRLSQNNVRLHDMNSAKM